MGRERPRPRLATAAPRPFSGVAHAPRVGVGDVLGRVSDAGEIESRNATVFSEFDGQK